MAFGGTLVSVVYPSQPYQNMVSTISVGSTVQSVSSQKWEWGLGSGWGCLLRR